MMRQGAAPESVVEVWYSASWTPGTFSNFHEALNKCVKIDDVSPKVKAFLVHWKRTTKIPMKRYFFSLFFQHAFRFFKMKKIEVFYDCPDFSTNFF